MRAINAFPYGPGSSERAIEIPWAISKYNGGACVLEVGCSFAYENPDYILALKALRIPELHGIDVSVVEAPDFIKKTADIRASGYPDDFFDFIFCISTLEHVGRDNARHYQPIAELDLNPAGPPPDVSALHEMLRILKPGGKLVLTVPFGLFEDHGWFINYDEQRIRDLFCGVERSVIRSEYFRYTELGWVPAEPRELAKTGYGSNGAPYAAGLGCFEIARADC